MKRLACLAAIALVACADEPGPCRWELARSEAADALRPMLPPPAAGTRTAGLALPYKANGPFTLTDSLSSLSISVSLEGSTDADAEASSGCLVYRGALEGGADLIHRPRHDGTEDYFSFAERPRLPEVNYRVAFSNKVAGARLVSNTLELLDAKGVPRLRMASPHLVSHDGKVTSAELSIHGCDFDGQCKLAIKWDDNKVAYPAIVDAQWTTVPILSSPPAAR